MNREIEEIKERLEIRQALIKNKEGDDDIEFLLSHISDLEGKINEHCQGLYRVQGEVKRLRFHISTLKEKVKELEAVDRHIARPLDCLIDDEYDQELYRVQKQVEKFLIPRLDGKERKIIPSRRSLGKRK